MPNTIKALRFIWWNVQEFAHFDPAHAETDRWPATLDEYAAKRERVERVLKQLCRKQTPQLLAFAEITDEAAHDIRNRLFPQYRVHVLASLYPKPGFHLAMLYHPSAGFENEDFLAVSNIPGTARAMGIVDHRFRGHRIRFFVCHWTARFEAQSEKWRSLTAQALGIAAYDFLHCEGTVDESRHVVIIGDLNEEPFGSLETWLNASRDRSRSTDQEHYTDEAIRRVRLYNCTWRLIGEQFPHPIGPTGRQAAGSYYWRKKKTWHAFDQIIVSGSLLTNEPPFLDERRLRVACGREDVPAELLGDDGFPCKFHWKNGAPVGVSDHFPICGAIAFS